MSGWFSPTTGTDALDYANLRQYPAALQERYRARGTRYWPPPNFVWVTGVITTFADNGDGSYTLTATDDGTGNNSNHWFNHNYSGNAGYSTFTDLIIDDDYSEDQCIHLRVYGSTNATSGNATYKVDSATDHILEDYVTGGWADPSYTVAALIGANSLVGRIYHILVRGCCWWSERWPIFPNDQEQWVGANLENGAIIAVTALTSSGATATAVSVGHQLITGDKVTMAGATSANGFYNGTGISVTVLDADTFTYPMIGSDDPTAGGSPTFRCTTANVAIGAYCPLPNQYSTLADLYPANSTGGVWAGRFVLMCQGDDGTHTKLKRVALTGNDGNNLLFARQAFSVAGQYAVMPAFNYSGSPHRSRYRVYSFVDSLCSGQGDPAGTMHGECNPFAGKAYLWINQKWASLYTYNPLSATADALGTTKLPAGFFSFNNGFGIVSEPCLDIDFYIDPNDTLNSPPDRYVNPNMHQTIHGWQLDAENLLGDSGGDPVWVEAKSYEALQAIPYLTRATTFSIAGINARTGATTTTTGTSINTSGFAGFFPYFPFNVYWAVLNASTGDNISAGTGSIDSSYVLSKDSGSFGGGETGQTLVISKGWTRHYDNEFRYMYRRQCWLPGSSGGLAVDPPTSTTPGGWNNRFPSLKYRETGPDGIVNSTYEYRPFVVGDYARYVGDNANDPTIHPETTSGTFAGYYAKFYEGKLAPAAQAALDASRVGTVTASDTMWVADDTKNWWPDGHYTIADLTGTDDGSGTTTTVSDSTKAGNGFWTIGAAGFLGFALKVTISGVDYYRQIWAYSGATTLTINPAEPLPVSAAGAAYAVVWPKYVVNRWLGRALKLTYADGTTQELTINGSDDQRLYFDNQGAPVPVGTAYEIIERPVGGVWRYNGTLDSGGNAGPFSWDAPTGVDARGGVDWLTDQTADQPTYNTDFGRARKGDFFLIQQAQELQAFLNVLIHLRTASGWSAANNYKYGEDVGNLVFGTGQSNAKANYLAYAPTTDNNNPFACVYAATKCGGAVVACYDHKIGRRFATGTASLAVAMVASAKDWYAISRIPSDPATGGSGQAASAVCPTIAVFDDEGDGLILDRWHNYSADGATTTTSPFSATPCGNPALPLPGDIGPAPAACPVDCNWFSGYRVDNSGWVICKYDPGSGGGFIYS